MSDYGAAEAVRRLSSCFGRAGFEGRGRRWRAGFEEVIWTIELDQAPGTRLLGIDLKADLAAVPFRPALLVHFDNHDRGSLSRFEIGQALQLDSGIAEEERCKILNRLSVEVVSFIQQMNSLAPIKRGHAAGQLDSAFVHKDARQLLG